MPNIEFVYTNNHTFNVVDRPVPATTFMPQWYRDLEQYHGGKLITIGTGVNATAKKCVPFLDGMTVGYTVPLWTDLNVIKNKNGKTEINWRTTIPVFEIHPGAENYVPPPFGYGSTVWKFLTHFRVKTPAGYSVLVTAPSGHFQSPFRPLPAVIDTDGDILDFSYPMWLKDDYEGIIERGIPMVTIIPFKRENWKATYSHITNEQNAIDADNWINKTIKNYYRNNVWNKKDYK